MALLLFVLQLLAPPPLWAKEIEDRVQEIQERAQETVQDTLRVARPAITLNMSTALFPLDQSREAIAEAAESPGICRGFLVWRQRYAHLAICNTYLCHGSCIEFGDGCLVSAQSPVLSQLINDSDNGKSDQNSCSNTGASSRCH